MSIQFENEGFSNTASSQSFVTSQNNPQRRSLSAWIIAKGIVKTEKQALYLQLVLTILLLLIAGYVFAYFVLGYRYQSPNQIIEDKKANAEIRARLKSIHEGAQTQQ
jgi:hypothetical protein